MWTNTGHGHVNLRPDGMRARCGGPGICKECALDFVRKNKTECDDQLLDKTPKQQEEEISANQSQSQKVLIRFQDEIEKKNSWGKNELIRLIARLSCEELK